MRLIAAALAAELLVAALAAASVSAVAAPPEIGATEVRATVAKSQLALNLQTEFPRSTPPEQPINLDWPTIPQKLVQILLWGAVAVVLVILIINARDHLGQGCAHQMTDARVSETKPEETAARLEAAQADADELARQGQFGPAMHILLLKSLGELRRFLNLTIAVSLTSREILSRPGLNQEARAALTDLVNRVELAWFGAQEVGAAEYAACRLSFEALTGALRQGRRPL